MSFTIVNLKLIYHKKTILKIHDLNIVYLIYAVNVELVKMCFFKYCKIVFKFKTRTLKNYLRTLTIRMG